MRSKFPSGSTRKMRAGKRRGGKKWTSFAGWVRTRTVWPLDSPPHGVKTPTKRRRRRRMRWEPDVSRCRALRARRPPPRGPTLSVVYPIPIGGWVMARLLVQHRTPAFWMELRPVAPFRHFPMRFRVHLSGMKKMVVVVGGSMAPQKRRQEDIPCGGVSAALPPHGASTFALRVIHWQGVGIAVWRVDAWCVLPAFPRIGVSIWSSPPTLLPWSRKNGGAPHEGGKCAWIAMRGIMASGTMPMARVGTEGH